MHKNGLQECLLAGALVLCAAPGIAAEQEVSAVEVVSAIEDAFGVTPSQRRKHTKGTCAVGEFVGRPEAAAYSRSPLFSGRLLPVVARFSLAGGKPNAPDTAKNPRGMALEFRLPDGGLQHMTMLNTPMFGAAKPETFLAQMIAQKPDPATGKPDPAKLKAFRDSHPDNAPQAEFLAKNNPPVSYANSAYFGIHTFKFIDRDNRTRHGPVRWDMVLTLGEPGDPQDNPTLAWPEGRKEVKAGTLTISAAMPQPGAACEKINFDPLVMGDGIEPTNDPILLFRSPAYAVSFAKRMGGQ